MALFAIGISSLLLLIIAYHSYGRYISRQVGLNDARTTPAQEKNDGVDFVPTSKFYLFSQHFSAISAAGPIAGPIMACGVWGFGPCLLWIALGVVLIGAVHDFLSLTVSVRHGAASIAEVASRNLSKRAGFAMMAFIWLSLIYVLISFTDITAASFVGVTEELEGLDISFNPGGAVAMGAVIYLSIALLMGIVERYLKTPLWLSSIIFVPLAFSSVWLGSKFSTILLLDAKAWCLLILAYCVVASLLPVWLLLQPRGYLGGFFLYAALLVGLIGIFSGQYEIKQMAFKTWDNGQMTGALMPFLFVTIACGACSGFHGLVCSGTTAKQIAQESHMPAVGFGAMLCEAMVAVIALSTIMIWSPAEIAGLKPGAIYGKGLGEFISLIIGKENLHIAITFGAMAFSTFVFDTIDVATRLGRYLLQEMFKWPHKWGALLATLMTIALPFMLVNLADPGSYLQFWTLFGASNQLMAALSLLFITLWLYQAKKRIAYTLLPMIFVLVITFWALLKIAINNLTSPESSSIMLINGSISLALIGLAIYLLGSAILKLRLPKTQVLPELEEG